MKKHSRFAITIIIVGILVFGFSLNSLAQDEQEGFVKRMWKKFRGKEEVVKEERQEKKTIKPEPVAKEKTPVREEPDKEPDLLTGRDSEERRVAPPSREEMLEMIDRNLSVYGDEISEKVGNIIKKTDMEGNVSYTYLTEAGNEVEFTDLEDETLFNLLRRVLNEATFIRNERINLQLQQMRQLQSLQNMQQPPRAVRPPQVNRTYTPPPPVPTPPPQTPQPPQVPQPPPQRR